MRARWMLLVFVGFFLPMMLWAQDTTVVTDKTGLFGPIIDRFWPMIVTFLTSLTLKIITIWNKSVAAWPEPAKWAALYFFALGWNIVARLLDLGEVDPNAPLFALSFVQMGVAGLIYKFAGHKVPVVTTTTSDIR